jgi:hypothetical protein
MQLDDLDATEQLAFGGLARMMVRSDGSFSEAEEAKIEEVAADLGGVALFWKLVSASAQEHVDDEDAIRAHATAVTRPEARTLIRETLHKIAEAEGIEDGERELLDWLDETWA